LLIQKNDIKLRALESNDLDWLFTIENDTRFWEISNTIQPFSKELLANYIANAHLDIFSIKQLRLVILYKKEPVGLIDLFDFDPIHHRAGLGILITPEYQSKGIASTAIEIVIEYAKSNLQLHQLYANITIDNTRSIKLFQKLGFIITGTKKDWIYTKNQYKDEHILQLLF
jgi:diamine N-acetyltransferase